MKKIITILILVISLSACGGKSVIDSVEESVNTPPKATSLSDVIKSAIMDQLRDGKTVVFSQAELSSGPGKTKEFYFGFMNNQSNDCFEISIECTRAQEGECILEYNYPEKINLEVYNAKIYPIHINVPENAVDGLYVSTFKITQCEEETPFYTREVWTRVLI